MVSRPRQLVAPLYLFLCLIIGGSAQGIWGNMVLQLARAGDHRLGGDVARPVNRWSSRRGSCCGSRILGDRRRRNPADPAAGVRVAAPRRPAKDRRGLSLLGIALPALPLSLTPYKSLDSLLGADPGRWRSFARSFG